jgi:hypothetical protein
LATSRKHLLHVDLRKYFTKRFQLSVVCVFLIITNSSESNGQNPRFLTENNKSPARSSRGHTKFPQKWHERAGCRGLQSSHHSYSPKILYVSRNPEHSMLYLSLKLQIPSSIFSETVWCALWQWYPTLWPLGLISVLVGVTTSLTKHHDEKQLVKESLFGFWSRKLRVLWEISRKVFCWDSIERKVPENLWWCAEAIVTSKDSGRGRVMSAEKDSVLSKDVWWGKDWGGKVTFGGTSMWLDDEQHWRLRLAYLVELPMQYLLVSCLPEFPFSERGTAENFWCSCWSDSLLLKLTKAEAGCRC